MSSICTASDVAHWFLLRAKAENVALKHMKLQKLAYFAYGWCAAYLDESLFPEEICAWQHGPVVEKLYHEYKPFKNHPIAVDGITAPKLRVDVQEILAEVWDAYSPCTDTHLRNITHRHDSPWSNVYNRRDRSIVIPTSEIQSYFKSLSVKYDSENYDSEE